MGWEAILEGRRQVKVDLRCSRERLLDSAGEGHQLGIGSLHLQQGSDKNSTEHLNMHVPIDLLKPIYDDMLTLGRPNHPPRPWLGMRMTS